MTVYVKDRQDCQHSNNTYHHTIAAAAEDIRRRGRLDFEEPKGCPGCNKFITVPKLTVHRGQS